MNKDELFKVLWDNYTAMTPSAKRIKQVFEERGETVENDHIAIRTFNDPRVNIEVLAAPIKKMGYVEKGTYKFEDKKLNAHHYEHAEDEKAPKIFISELLLEEFSDELRAIVSNALDQIPYSTIDMDALLLKGRLWELKYQDYELLRKESEYASWVYVFGFCANHFTVLVNALKTFKGIAEVNAFLKEKGFKLNNSGGEIKGTPEQLLEQSSTIADQIAVEFDEGVKTIPSCYYEFANRYKMADGKLYTGFIAASADKIFESTDVSLVEKVMGKN